MQGWGTLRACGSGHLSQGLEKGPWMGHAPHLQGACVVWVWPQSGLGLKRVREPKPPPAQTQVWDGHDARGSSNLSAPSVGSGVSRGGCSGLSPSMPCSSTGTHHHPCPAPLQGNIPAHALFSCKDTSLSMPCFPAGTRSRSPSMPCSSAGHVLVPYPAHPCCCCGLAGSSSQLSSHPASLLHPSHPAASHIFF